MSLIDQVDNDIKLTKNMTIKPFDTVETMGIIKVLNHEKGVNIIIEPSPVERQGNEVYTVPGYDFLRAGSKQMGLALRNLSSRTVTLKRGTVVAHITATKKVPPQLAPRLITKAFSVNTHSSAYPSVEVEIERKPTNLDVPQVHICPPPERLDKLFGKLDLSGAQSWIDQERQEIRDLLTEYHNLCALDDLELGKASLVKHNIKLTNETPFKERY